MEAQLGLRSREAFFFSLLRLLSDVLLTLADIGARLALGMYRIKRHHPSKTYTHVAQPIRACAAEKSCFTASLRVIRLPV